MSEDDVPRHSDADLLETYQVVVDHVLSHYDDPTARNAAVTAAIAFHMHATHDQLPAEFALSQIDE